MRPHRTHRISTKIQTAIGGSAITLALFGHTDSLPAQARGDSNSSLSVAQIAKQASPASATILAISAAGDTVSQGSGFFVSASGLLLTNWHVLRGATRAVIIPASGPRYERVSFIAGDSSIDLVLLKVPGYGLRYLNLRTDAPAVGEQVVAVGSPLGLATTVSSGIVSALRSESGRDRVQITAAINPGSSGGPVLDAAGRVFAVATSRIRGSEQLNFAVPVRYATGWMNGTLREQPLSSEFARIDRSELQGRSVAPQARRSPAAPSTRLTEFAPLALPSRTDRPLEQLRGVWTMEVEWHWDSLGIRARQNGIFVADELLDGIGWLATDGLRLGPTDSAHGPLSMSVVRSFRRTSRGGVVLDVAGDAFDGYQTRGGIALTATGRDGDGDHFIVRGVGTAVEFRPSVDTGIFDATCSSFWYSDKDLRSESRTNWSGSAAILVANDSAFVDMALENDAGGSAAFTAAGPIGTDGAFSLATANGSTLIGSLRAGLLSAQYRDQRRDGSSFRGTVRAVRR